MTGLSSFVAVVLAATLWVVLRDDEYVAPPPEAPADVIQPAAAAASLQDLGRAIRAGDEEAAAVLAPDGSPASARALRSLVRNAGTIPVRDVSLRYLGELGGADEKGRWSAHVDLGWRFADADPRTSHAEVQVQFAAAGGGVSIVSVGGSQGREPVWLSDEVHALRGPQTLVVATDRVRYYQRLARRAVDVVHRVLPGWTSRLVVEVPGSARALDRAMAAEAGAFANIAGVTAVPDGATGTGVTAHVFLNPDRLSDLQQQGAQVVVSHEAAHVALHATATSLPAWLSEGFADYVALRDLRLPLATTASQIIEQVRRDGAPTKLPDDQDFDETSEYFGATYEASWFACRLLAERAGEKELLRFYRRAEGAPDFSRLFRTTFGIREEAFTRQWRQALSDLAA